MAKELTRKERQITQLYLETTQQVVKNVDSWITFLKRASYNYKYRFDEQILIYAQKPNAVACAETILWNKKLKRWINKGAKGIALITERNGELGLRFVFDVSDTNSNVYGKKLKLWTAEEKYTQDIIESLEDRFGTMEDNSNLPFAIISTVYNHITDNIQDYMEDLKSVIKNSELGKMEQEKLENTFFEIALYSSIAVIMSRCGIDVNEYIPKECFKNIEKFDTFETISILGTATRDLSKEILLEISKTVINLQKEEKKKNYTFDREKQNIYNQDKEKGSVEDEYNLQAKGQLSNTRINNREDKQESESREIRKNEVSIPKREQEGNLHNANREQSTNETFDRNRQNSEKENRANGRTNETEIWNNRGIESKQSNGMGRTDEQHSSDSRTDSSERTNLQLKQEDNREFTEKEVDNTSFSDEQNNLDDYSFMVNDVLYIGVKEFTILSVNNEEITMYDNEFPLDQRTTTIKDILPKIAENPMNDYLRDREIPETEKIAFDKQREQPQEEKTKKIEQNKTEVIKDNEDLKTFFENIFNKYEITDFEISINDNGKIDGIVINDNQYSIIGALKYLVNMLDYYDLQFVGNDELRIKNRLQQARQIEKQEIINKELIYDNKLYTVIDIDENEKDEDYAVIQDNVTKIATIEPIGYVKYLINENLTEKDKLKEKIGVDTISNLFETIISHQNIDIKLLSDNSKTFDNKMQILRDSCEYYENDFGGFNPTDGSVYIAENSIDIELYSDHSEYSLDWNEFTRLFIDYAQTKEKENIKQEGSEENLYYQNERNELKEEKAERETNVEKTPKIVPNIIKSKRKIQDFILYPEIPETDRNNFKITDNNLGAGTAKEKFKNNIEAIKVLKLCEEQNRYATQEEQQILSKYVGWGGLKSAFEETNDNWSNEYKELKELLTEEEYKNARESSLTAYYTPPVVIRNIYKALQNMGLKQANILEPSCRSR